MKKFLTGLVAVFILIFSATTIAACNKEVDRNCNIFYSFKSTDTLETVADIYFGNTYYFEVTYSVGDENNNKYFFTSFINANDNILVTYHEGASATCTIVGNSLEVSYNGRSATNLIAVYKLDVKSKCDMYLRFKDINNISFEPTEIKISAKEQ